MIHDLTLTIWEQTEKLGWYGVQARLGLGDEESSRQSFEGRDELGFVARVRKIL